MLKPSASRLSTLVDRARAFRSSSSSWASFSVPVAHPYAWQQTCHCLRRETLRPQAHPHARHPRHPPSTEHARQRRHRHQAPQPTPALARVSPSPSSSSSFSCSLPAAASGHLSQHTPSEQPPSRQRHHPTHRNCSHHRWRGQTPLDPAARLPPAQCPVIRMHGGYLTHRRAVPRVSGPRGGRHGRPCGGRRRAPGGAGAALRTRRDPRGREGAGPARPQTQRQGTAAQRSPRRRSPPSALAARAPAAAADVVGSGFGLVRRLGHLYR